MINYHQSWHAIRHFIRQTTFHSKFDLDGSTRNRILLPKYTCRHQRRSIHLGKHLDEVSRVLAGKMDEVLVDGISAGWNQAKFRSELLNLERQRDLNYDSETEC